MNYFGSFKLKLFDIWEVTLWGRISSSHNDDKIWVFSKNYLYFSYYYLSFPLLCSFTHPIAWIPLTLSESKGYIKILTFLIRVYPYFLCYY